MNLKSIGNFLVRSSGTPIIVVIALFGLTIGMTALSLHNKAKLIDCEQQSSQALTDLGAAALAATSNCEKNMTKGIDAIVNCRDYCSFTYTKARPELPFFVIATSCSASCIDFAKKKGPEFIKRFNKPLPDRAKLEIEAHKAKQSSEQ